VGRHPAQLRICHQRIGDDPADYPPSGQRRLGRRRQARIYDCDLPAHAWCFDCDYYVCEIHLTSRHALHRTQLVSEE
jgi:hypothetical protein